MDFFKGCENLSRPDKRTRYIRGVSNTYRVQQVLQEHGEGLRLSGGIMACLTRCGQLREWQAEERVRLIFQRRRKLKFGREDDANNDSLLTSFTNNLDAHKDELDEYSVPGLAAD